MTMHQQIQRKDVAPKDVDVTPQAPVESAPMVALQQKLGNAHTAARVQLKKDGDEPTPPTDGDTPAPGRPEETKKRTNPSTTTEVKKLAEAGATTAPQLLAKIAELAKDHPGWPADCFANSAAMGKIAAKLSARQMHTALQYMKQPTGNADRVAWRLIYCDKAQPNAVPAQVVREIMGTDSVAALDKVLESEDWVKIAARAGCGPLSIFMHMQGGLTKKAAESTRFVKWLITGSSPTQIFKAVKGVASSDRAALAAKINGTTNGWTWLDSIDGATLEQADRVALKGFIASANPAGKGKLSATLGTMGPAAPVEAKTLLATLKALKTAGDTDSKKWTEAVQAASKADRLACAADTALMTWATTSFGGVLHPTALFNVGAGERADFLQKKGYLKFVINKTTWPEMVALTTDRSYIAKVGAVFNANDALCQAWIGKLPGKAEISAMHQSDIRALGLVLTSAGRKKDIRDKFGDVDYPDRYATKAAGPMTAGIKNAPITTLQAELDKPAPDQVTVVRLCGELGATRGQLTGDATRMGHLKAKLSNNNYYHAVRALGIKFKEQVTLLTAKTVGAPKYRELFANAKTNDRLLVAMDDALVAKIKTQTAPAPPLQLFGFTTSADQIRGLATQGFQQWFFAVTPATEVLRVATVDETTATAFGRFFDGNNAWGWMTQLPDGASLTEVEQQGLTWLSTRTNDASTKKSLTAKLKDSGAKKWAGKEKSRTSKETKKGADPGSPVVAEITKVLGKGSPDAATLIELCGRLARPADRTYVVQNLLSQMLNVFSKAQTARAFALLKVSLVSGLKYLHGVAAKGEIIHSMLAAASKADRLKIFDSADAVAAVRDLGLSPLQACPGLETQLAAVQQKAEFWKWLDRTERRIRVMQIVAQMPNIAQAVAAIKAAGVARVFTNLPKAQGLTGADRDAVDAVFMGCNDADTEKQLFAARFALSLSGTWTSKERGDLKLLYNELKKLPIAHVTKHPKLTTMNRHHAGGGTYDEGRKQVNIGSDTTAEFTGYQGQAGKEFKEKYFSHTVAHEIGHGVDALMGSKTSIIFGTYGWKEYGQGEVDQWLTSVGGFTGPKANTMTAQDKKDVKDHLMAYLDSGGGTIAGPSQPAGDLAAKGSAWERFPQIRIVREMNKNSPGMGYKTRYAANGKVFSINYYYKRFMECSAAAGQAAVRDYSCFAPAEMFADWYAEFYRTFDGIDDKKLGGNLPGDVKAWFMANVHAVGGRSPHEIKGGKKTPRGDRVNH